MQNNSQDQLISSYNDIFEWCLNHIAHPPNNSVIVYDPTNLEYYISHNTITIALNDTETFLPYRIDRCNDFTLLSNNIISFAHFPKISVLGTSLPILKRLCLKNTNRLDLSNLNKEYSQISHLQFSNINNLYVSHLKNICVDEIIVFDNVNSLNVYDLFNFVDLNFRRIEYINQTYKFKNLQNIVNLQHTRSFYINYSNVYTASETDILRKIIDSFMHVHMDKRKEHVMDITLQLLDNDFLEEV